MDPVTAVYILYRGWKWLRGKNGGQNKTTSEKSSGNDGDGDLDDLLDVFL